MPPASNAPPLSLGRHFPDREAPQLRADVAVIVPTILRPALLDAVRSVYDQTFEGRVQLLIGADLKGDQAGRLFDLLETRPANLSATVLTLPYSTSSRHGGVHPAWDGGALRPILSFMANAQHLAYLDDDNTWEPDHLASLMAASRARPGPTVCGGCWTKRPARSWGSISGTRWGPAGGGSRRRAAWWTRAACW
ncbi:hypothetical protein BH10PSE5_BH10PSE5_20050 [soil metagenome]